jgi:FMN-dependent NADH-azoreductase
MTLLNNKHLESSAEGHHSPVLHINSSARMSGSNTRILGQYLVEQLGQPVISRDLAAHPLPAISAEDLVGVHGSSSEQRDSLAQQLAVSNALIEELRTADTLVLGAPMYNFGIPATLKQWIDAICRAGVSFTYTEQGPVGLLGVKRAFIITSSGGTEVGSDSDFASRYLAHICRFIGIDTIHVIDAGGSKRTPQEIIERGKRQIDDLLANAATVRAA